ncbi:hypothetical protein RIF29_33941 [Crotalaria pallida]|uniref:Uncharacterized protein n=1 Tax=Crotalaria pallida TaxID=3830 RepID=A0AAN9E8W1_CROPI
MAAQGNSLVVTDQQTNKEGNLNPELHGSSSEIKGQYVDNGLNKEDSCFGPWMIAKTSYRRKNVASHVGKKNFNLTVNPNGSRFEILQNNEPDLNASADQRAPTSDSQKNLGRASLQKPKVVKAHALKPGLRQTKDQSSKILTKLKQTAPLHTTTGSGSSMATVKPILVDSKEKEAIRKKEEEILRIMRWKEKEVLAFANSLRTVGASFVEPHSKPPNPSKSSGSNAVGGTVPLCEDKDGLAASKEGLVLQDV